MSRYCRRRSGRMKRRGCRDPSATQSQSYAPKAYTADVLTVAQLATCIRKASKLDEDSDRLEASRTVFLSSKSEIDLASTAIEFQRPRVDHYSQKSVDAFNALINRYNMLVTNGKTKQASFNALVDAHNAEADAYNAECVKKYYADDLPDAQKLAAQPDLPRIARQPLPTEKQGSQKPRSLPM